MKRSALSRTTPLRSDPEAVSAFQRRGRQGLARGNGPERKPTAERQPERPRRKEPPWREPFRARRPARTQRCFRCPEPARHWHHLLPQRALRAHVRSLRRNTTDLLLRQYCRRLLRDERNLVPVCPDCHAQIESCSAPVRQGEVETSGAFVFAKELGEWAVVRLEQELKIPAAGSSGITSQEVPRGG